MKALIAAADERCARQVAEVKGIPRDGWEFFKAPATQRLRGTRGRLVWMVTCWHARATRHEWDELRECLNSSQAVVKHASCPGLIPMRYIQPA